MMNFTPQDRDTTVTASTLGREYIIWNIKRKLHAVVPLFPEARHRTKKFTHVLTWPQVYHVFHFCIEEIVLAVYLLWLYHLQNYLRLIGNHTKFETNLESSLAMKLALNKAWKWVGYTKPGDDIARAISHVPKQLNAFPILPFSVNGEFHLLTLRELLNAESLSLPIINMNPNSWFSEKHESQLMILRKTWIPNPFLTKMLYLDIMHHISCEKTDPYH